jgi:hypothetical protein
MHYFFDNTRNNQGLCATPGCDGKPVYLLVYKYCEKCFAAIARDLEAGLIPNIERIQRPRQSSSSEQ